MSLVLAAGCASQGDRGAATGKVSLVPSPVPLAPFQVMGKEYRFEKEGLVVVAASLDEDGLARYYEGLGLDNPFDVVYPRLQPAIFLLRIENHTPQNVFFNPALSGLADDDGKPYVNRDLTDFYSYLGDDAARDRRLAALKPTLFDTQARLAPGQAVERLLAYDAIGGGVKGVKLILRDIYVGEKALEVPFLFEVRYR